jgi:hypothetical protein
MSDPEEQSVPTRIAELERRTKNLQRTNVVLAATLLCLGWHAFKARPQIAEASDRVLRARGIVIQDASGRARILLGAPTPDVPERNRKDPTTAIVVLGENGADRLIVGYGPNPMVGGKVYKRDSSGVGVLIHDRQGNERGGFSFADTGKAVISLDRPTGDAVAMSVDDRSGFAGVVVAYPNKIGKFTQAAGLYSVGDQVALRMDDREENARLQMQLDKKGDPRLAVLDKAGKTTDQWPK